MGNGERVEHRQMINLFITYRCNLACTYCFARELGDIHTHDMSVAVFQKFLQWIEGASPPAVGLIGGEPTLHPGLAEMAEAIRNAGIAPVVFTNGLFTPELADRLCRSVANFVVNYNDPVRYSSHQRMQVHETLARLSKLGARITFSKNFSPDNLDYDYLLEGIVRYGVRAVRYDLSRPSRSAANDFFPMEATASVWNHILSFVSRCESLGVRTGLDCCLRLCELSTDQRCYLQRVSMKFSGICHPCVDIHPDLSASYCLPMYDIRVPDATAFADSFSLMGHLAKMVGHRRFEHVADECFHCPEFRHTCQGGCLASKRYTPVTMIPSLPSPENRCTCHEIA